MEPDYCIPLLLLTTYPPLRALGHRGLPCISVADRPAPPPVHLSSPLSAALRRRKVLSACLGASRCQTPSVHFLSDVAATVAIHDTVISSGSRFSAAAELIQAKSKVSTRVGTFARNRHQAERARVELSELRGLHLHLAPARDRPEEPAEQSIFITTITTDDGCPGT